MDRHAVEQHALFWTIDASGEVFDDCQLLLLQEYFADRSVGTGTQMDSGTGGIIEKIAFIQEELQRAQDFNLRQREFSVGARVPKARRQLARR